MHGIFEFRKKLHYLLQKPNIHQSQRYVAKYFFCGILSFTGVVDEYPINVHVDNVGAIFILDITSVSKQTKFIDVCNHFIWDYLEDRTVKIKKICLEENLTDQFIKNLSNGTFEFITSRYVNCM